MQYFFSETRTKWYKMYNFSQFIQIFRAEMLFSSSGTLHTCNLEGLGLFHIQLSSLVNNLDDQLYNTFPKQPYPKPSSKGTKPKPPPKTTDVPAPKPSSSSGATPKTTLSDVPPDDNPIEEANIWAEILKLEGRQWENKVAEGFQTWLKKSIDSSLYEVQNITIFIKLIPYTCLV